MTIGRQKHNLRSPNVLLRAIAVSHHRLKLVNPVRHKQMMLAVDVPAKHPYRVKLP